MEEVAYAKGKEKCLEEKNKETKHLSSHPIFFSSVMLKRKSLTFGNPAVTFLAGRERQI